VKTCVAPLFFFFLPLYLRCHVFPPFDVICKVNDYHFHLLRFRLVMAIENPIHFFLSLQIHIRIDFTLKSRYFLFDSIYIIMSPKVTKISSLPNLPLVLFLKSLRSLGCQKRYLWLWSHPQNHHHQYHQRPS